LILAAEAARLPTPFIIWAIAGAIVLSYVAFLISSPEQQQAIDYAFALIPQRFNPDSAEHYVNAFDAAAPLFGHAFLHLAWWHAGLNAFFFFLLGRLPALRLGWWRFLVVFFAGAVLGGVAFIALNWGKDDVAIGASGAVCGVFSAYFLALRPTWRQAIADPQIRNAFGSLFFLNVVLMGVVSELGWFPIAWEGHLGGFVGGALAYIALAPRYSGPWIRASSAPSAHHPPPAP
jgi:membrane associated rhomboid family serine protease